MRNRTENNQKVAYLVSKFPTLTETFILREIVELERQGQPITVYTIRREHPEVVHKEALPYIDRLRTAKSISAPTIKANLLTFLSNPFLYVWLVLLTIRELWGEWHLFVRDLYMFPRAIAFARMMRAEGITHVHAHWATHTAYMAYIINRFTGITYSFTAHAHDIYIRKAMLCRKVRAASFVATISHFNVEEMVNDCGEDVRSKLHVVRCGVLPEHLQVTRNRLDGARPLTILTVASLRDYKGHPYAVQAAKILKNYIPNFRWQVVGGGPDRAELESQIREAGVEDVFILLGGRSEDQVRDLLAEADMFVMSSIMLPDRRMDGIPVALMEAMAAGLPTVATNVSGIPELVEEKVTGRLVPERNAEALAQAIIELYRDPQEAQRLAQAGKQRVNDEFTIADNAERLRRLFATV